MRYASVLSLAAFFAVLACSGSLWAQYGSNTGGGGGGSSGSMFNNRTMSTGSNSSGFGIGSSNNGSGAFGQNGGPVQQSQQSVGGQASSLNGNNGFIGANTQQGANGGSNFVGAAQANSQQGGYGSSMGGMGGLGGMGGGMGSLGGLGGMSMGGGMGGYGQNGRNGPGGYGGFMGGMSQNNPQSQIRTRVTITWAAPSAAPSQVSTELAGHLTSLPGLHWDSAPKVELQGRTVVLRGVVASEHDRDLAERVARLQPTVSQVVNQLVVARPAAGPAEPAQPATSGLHPATGTPGPSPAGR